MPLRQHTAVVPTSALAHSPSPHNNSLWLAMAIKNCKDLATSTTSAIHVCTIPKTEETLFTATWLSLFLPGAPHRVKTPLLRCKGSECRASRDQHNSSTKLKTCEGHVQADEPWLNVLNQPLGSLWISFDPLRSPSMPLGRPWRFPPNLRYSRLGF